MQRLSCLPRLTFNLVPWLMFVVLALVLQRSQGHYHESSLIRLTVALFLYALLPVRFSRAQSWPLFWWSVPSTFLAFKMVQKGPQLLFANVAPFIGSLTFCLKVSATALLLTTAQFVFDRDFFKKGLFVLFSLIIAGQITARVFTIKASPHPKIDVFTTTTEASLWLLKGENPYQKKYPDIYRPGTTAAFSYWPGVLYWTAPAQKFLGDVRFAYLLAELLITWVLFRLARGFGLSPHLSLVPAVTWLVFPSSLFILEQGWIDGLLAVWFGVAILALLKNKLWVAAAALGYALAVKQYAAIGFFTTLVWTYRVYGIKAAAKLGLGAGAIFALLVSPFVGWDPVAFYRSTLGVFIHFPARPDALTLNAWALEHWHRELPWPTLLIPVALAMQSLYQLQRQPSVAQWARTNAVIYGGAFLFAKQAFCNYYYLVAFFVLLEAVVRSALNFKFPTSFSGERTW
jgi:hypothetical protein